MTTTENQKIIKTRLKPTCSYLERMETMMCIDVRLN